MELEFTLKLSNVPPKKYLKSLFICCPKSVLGVQDFTPSLVCLDFHVAYCLSCIVTGA